MPGSVQVAAPTYVLPLSLSSALTESREYPVLQNTYAQGESQRTVQSSVSRKQFKLGKRLTPSQAATLRAFYEARKGSLQAFYHYHPYETSPLFSYDPTGAATTGRYTVRFEGEWSQETGLGRSDVAISLVEVG